MAGFIPAESKKILLDVLNGKAVAAGFTGNRYLGLLTGLPETVVSLASISGFEVTTGGYARQLVAFNNATITDELVQAASTAALTSANMTADMTPAPYAFTTTASSGYVGTLCYVWQLSEPVAALSGKPFYVPVNGLIIE